MTTPTAITAYLDPLCPWAWLTSRWLEDLSTRHGLTLEPRRYSLVRGNATEAPPVLEEKEAPLRLMAVGYEEGGDIGAFATYTALGNLHHTGKRPYDRATLEEAAATSGLPANAISRVYEDETLGQTLIEHHEKAVALGVFGVPTLVIGDNAPVFGPVIDKRLDPDTADALLAQFTSFSNSPFLMELKRVARTTPELAS